MPRIAILSDVHANAPALKAVLRAARKARAQRIVFGGDTVGYGGSPRYCVEKVMSLGGESVLGNHDFYANALRSGELKLPDDRDWRRNQVWAGVAEAANSLDGEAADWLAKLPLVLELPGALLAHSALHDIDEWPYLRSLRDARPTLNLLRKSGVGVGFFGHTHRQGLYFEPDEEVVPEEMSPQRHHLPEGAVCAVLVGSVGQPRDGDSRAGWALWDPDSRVIEFHRTPYPALQAAKDIVAADLPIEAALRLLDEPTTLEFLKTVGF